MFVLIEQFVIQKSQARAEDSYPEPNTKKRESFVYINFQLHKRIKTTFVWLLYLNPLLLISLSIFLLAPEVDRNDKPGRKMMMPPPPVRSAPAPLQASNTEEGAVITTRHE